MRDENEDEADRLTSAATRPTIPHPNLHCHTRNPWVIASHLMKRLFVPFMAIALVATLLAACNTPQSEKPQPKPPGKTGFHTPTPPPTVPDNAPEESKPKNADVGSGGGDQKPPNPVPDKPPVPQGDIPYAKPVPGKPGFVFSPYEPYKGYIDVRGFPPGTEVKDPYSDSGKSFLVP